MEKSVIKFCTCPKCGYTCARGRKCGMCGKKLIPDKSDPETTETNGINRDAETLKKMSKEEYDRLFFPNRK